MSRTSCRRPGNYGNRENLGILGIGIELPDRVRRNDAWSGATVAKWELTDTSDPFCGSRERRVVAADKPSSEMEAAACQKALDDAGIDPSCIDFLIGASAVPDQLAAPNACAVHHHLGLDERCMSWNIEASFNAFSVQMEIARGWMARRSHRYGLLYQSSAMSKLVPMDAHFAPWFGDGATAVVVGPVDTGWGVLGSAHCTNGRLRDAMIAGVPGRGWYDPGRVRWYPGRPDAAHALFHGVAARARDVVHQALNQASISPTVVDFYASHQPAAWFRGVTQAHIGLERARSLDTFSWAGSLGAANVPLVLGIARQEGLIRRGDIVVTHTGGLGITWSSQVMRWTAKQKD